MKELSDEDLAVMYEQHKEHIHLFNEQINELNDALLDDIRKVLK